MRIPMLPAALLLAAALFSTVTTVASAAPVAMITDLKGKVTLVESGRSRAAALLAYLEPDSRLQLESGAQVVLTYFAKPIEVTLAGPAEASIAADGARVARGAKPAVRALDAGRTDTARKFEPIARDKLALATVHMRAAPRPAPRPVYPADTAILSTTPTLEWAEISTASGYRIVITDAAGATVLDQQVAKPPLAIPSERALRAGAAYEWRVEAKLASGSIASAESKFSVAEATRARSLERARPATDASFSERLLYAARLESEGLREDAKHLWQALAKERPEDETLKRWAGR